MDTRFTPAHRGGSGPPLVLLHGITDTWRTWELVLPALQERHAVFAPTLPGHAGGPPLAPGADADGVVDAVASMLDAEGLETAHIAGNSLGGHLALRLAARGRARSVVALAPAGGWEAGDPAAHATLDAVLATQAAARAAAPHADAAASTPRGRAKALASVVGDASGLPADLVAHVIRGAAACSGLEALDAAARRDGWTLDAAAVDCPVRIVWGTEDRLLEWPAAAVRYRRDWLPHADWVELGGAGHAPQLELPLETAQLILGVTAPGR
ncbi:MAG: alpha/beta fold hydrolase [Thermoleophilia bacterium]